MLKLFTKFLSNRRGTTSVEFALVVTAFLALLFGIFESGRMFLAWNSFQYAVENATRLALVTDGITELEIQDFVDSELAGMMVNPDSANVTVTRSTAASGVDFIEVDGTYSFQTLMPFLPDSFNTVTLAANSRLPVPP